ncbi:TVP38/TMEM64 family protein [Enterovirga rhinocerotis]|uniref:Putative membrane protein YdjX (TVP38/TMEM64 family) n=1 Tax=Enterovirga rhinocerotis TaxID=1339210 RepID=A0A4R7C5H2_9HYPH|nr:VTT domain-containing protein [Enterovirga rhinocerotis]TDR93431.1 putative membrane protein YdjX (TVP38/TMEM64 family) [Enterovirga rhinocerotis]
MIGRAMPALVLLIPLVAGVAAWFVFGPDALSLEGLLGRRDALLALRDSDPVLTLVLFTAVYFAIISSALPVGPPMSLIAGFLFGRWLGTGAILIAATGGALVVFTVARLSAGTPFGLRLRARAGRVYETAAADLRANAFGYLVVMRLVPFFPFFLVNILCGIVGMRPTTFAAATFLGRIPAAFLYVSLGAELGRASRVEDLARPEIALVLLGLALLALLPILLKRRRARASRIRPDVGALGTSVGTGAAPRERPLLAPDERRSLGD